MDHHDSVYDSCGTGVVGLIRNTLHDGETVGAVGGLSVGKDRPTRELLNHAVVISHPRDRLPSTTLQPFRLTTAIARLVWMLAGNDRLADIAFYEPGTARFSDNGATVPGSNFGRRLREPEPGLDQLQSIVERLRADPFTRRAVAAIYTPVDSTRESRDIPCLLDIAFHRRDDGLHTTTLMRSNNVYRLAPFNLFEFSFIGEIVAVEIGAPLGRMTHFCLSAHIYSDDVEGAQAWAQSHPPGAPVWPEMPSEPRPLQQVARLVELEAQLRHHAIDNESLEKVLAEAHDLHPYWRTLLHVLAAKTAHLRGIAGSAQLVDREIEPFTRQLLRDYEPALVPAGSDETS